MGHESDLAATLVGRGALYRVGQDRAGRWLAVACSGMSGGMFASRAAALRFALGETSYRRDAVVIMTEPVAFP